MPNAALLLYPLLGLLLCTAVTLRAEDDPAPALPGEPPAITLEFIGLGLVPTARVSVGASPRGTRAVLSRTWTYQVQPQPPLGAALDPRYQVAVSLVLSPERIFRSVSDSNFVVLPGRTWGHDHPLDLRAAHLPPGMVKIRVVIGESSSPWVNYNLPDVPADLPLAIASPDVRKLGSEHLERLAKTASAIIVRGRFSSGDHPWTRTFTLDAKDPLAPLLPKLLVDGKTNNLVADDQLARCAISGLLQGGTVEDGAMVLAVQPE